MNMNRVGIFWDYENCAPPSGTPGYVVAERLRATCGAYGSVTQFRAYLELSTPPPSASSQATGLEPNSNDLLCPPTSPKTLTLRSELQSSGVSLIDCPHNSRKNVADSMLACDLVCFALDNPTSQIPYASYLPASPYGIPNTPFSAIFPAPIPKTTIVLISGDRDFAYPLAVLKARKYEVGLIVPPGGAHPALRAQATWVMDWKDVLEGGSINLDGRFEASSSTNPRGRTDNTSMDSQINGLTPPVQGARRPSFASRRGSISNSRRGSVSALANPVPPPPHLAIASTVRIPTASCSFSMLDANESAPIPPASSSLPDGPSTSQPLSTSRPSRKPPLRRSTVKAGSRPSSRLRMGARSNRSERTDQDGLQPAKPEQARLRPLIVPVPLTASPIGSAGPSLAGMSPRGCRPQTPPLFSTNPTSPPPPAAPPAVPPHTSPPTKASTPLAKPPTPPKDALRALHRPPIPHVATPRPPVPESYQPAEVGAPSLEEQRLDGPASTSTLVAPTPKPSGTVLQSLLPAATALRPPVATGMVRPVLAVPPSIQASNTSTLAPATPVTPPASPPFTRWARLQPVHDDTDGDGERSTTTEKKRKEKAKERVDPAKCNEIHSLANSEQATGSTSKKNSLRLAVQVGMLLAGGEEPSAISGVDSILRSYTERSPKVERGDQKCCAPEDEGNSFTNSAEQKGETNAPSDPTVDEDDEEEERFHETFLATFSRPHICSHVPRTPATVKLGSLELTSEENTDNSQGGLDHKRPRVTTPRPVPRTSHSMPLIPMMQSLLAGVEGGQSIPGDHSDMAGVGPQSHEAQSHELSGTVENFLERLYSRTNSPTPSMPPPIRRRTSPSRILGTSDVVLDPLVDITYREFQFLIDVLERYRRNGQERPLRSLIGAEFTHDIFEQVKASSFKDHVQRAVTAGVVSIGGGPIQGREWISLNRNWQGLGLVID